MEQAPHRIEIRLSDLSVVAELECNPEVAAAEEAHGLLELVFGGGADAELVALDIGLDLLELLLFEELYNFSRVVTVDALLELDFPAHGAVGGRQHVAQRHVFHGHVPPD